jgi:hypothetical protein
VKHSSWTFPPQHRHSEMVAHAFTASKHIGSSYTVRLPSAAAAAALTLAACSDQTVVRDCVGRAALSLHLLKQLQSSLPAPSLLAGTDQAAVGDHTAGGTTAQHSMARRNSRNVSHTRNTSALRPHQQPPSLHWHLFFCCCIRNQAHHIACHRLLLQPPPAGHFSATRKLQLYTSS